MADTARKGIPKVRIRREVYQKIKKLAREGLPCEICGYLASERAAFRSGSFAPLIEVTAIFPLRNVDESPEHYRFDPAEQFEAFREAGKQGKKLIGTYHSHPATPSRMSEEDIRLAEDQKMIYGIFDVQGDILNFFTVKKRENDTRQVQRLISELS
ncbi:MAG: Mov34/MPN/PAD-1 family protein [Salinispira sp.]